MNNTLFIPNEIHIGQVERTDTYTGRLGYVIYRDNKGKLRKEKSWDSWRDHKIDPIVTTNEPTTGFTLNKGISRGGYDWYSERTEKIRVFDPRGFEFEITIDNLLGVLMHSDVSKRDIVQACVYAWNGIELILLPTNASEYEESAKHTLKQDMKVKSKELGIGYTYELKSGKEQVIYLGKYTIYKDVIEKGGSYGYTTRSIIQVEKRNQHVFFDPRYNTFEIKSPTTYVAQVVSEECHPDYANLVDKFHQLKMSQPIKGLRLVPSKFKDTIEVSKPPYQTDEEFDRNHGYNFASEAEYEYKGWYWMQLSEYEFIYVYVDIDVDYNGRYGTNSQRTAKVAITWNKSMRFDPVSRKSAYSMDAVFASYNREAQEAVQLDGLTPTSPAVALAVENLRSDLVAVWEGWVSPDYNNWPLSDELKQRFVGTKETLIKHNVGTIQAYLPNDQLAYDRYSEIPSVIATTAPDVDDDE